MKINLDALESVKNEALWMLRCIGQGKCVFDDNDLNSLHDIYLELKKEIEVLNSIFSNHKRRV